MAAILVAADNKINISKYAIKEDLTRIRGAVSSQIQPSPQHATPTTIIRKVAKPPEPISSDLSFVSSAELREILERDLAELNVARSQGLEKTAKTCMVLCGSIVEALILDRLSRDAPTSIAVASGLPMDLRPKSPTNLESWDLNEMVNVATHFSPRLLPDDAITGAHQLRTWRNLIHPGRELREARSKLMMPTKERANNAIAFLQFIARELVR